MKSFLHGFPNRMWRLSLILLSIIIIHCWAQRTTFDIAFSPSWNFTKAVCPPINFQEISCLSLLCWWLLLRQSWPTSSMQTMFRFAPLLLLPSLPGWSTTTFQRRLVATMALLQALSRWSCGGKASLMWKKATSQKLTTLWRAKSRLSSPYPWILFSILLIAH